MDVSDCPEPWVHDPDGVRIKLYDNIAVENIWKNTETGEVLVQYMTITTVRRNNYVESFADPEKVKSRLRQVKDLLSKDDVEIELDKVNVTAGAGVAKCKSPSTATEKAFEHMRGELDDYYYQR